MESIVIKNRIANKRNPGYLDPEQLDEPSGVGGFGLSRYIYGLRKERANFEEGGDIDRALFQIYQSCYKYEHVGVRPILSESIAWLVQCEVLNGADIDFEEAAPRQSEADGMGMGMSMYQQ